MAAQRVVRHGHPSLLALGVIELPTPRSMQADGVGLQKPRTPIHVLGSLKPALQRQIPGAADARRIYVYNYARGKRIIYRRIPVEAVWCGVVWFSTVTHIDIQTTYCAMKTHQIQKRRFSVAPPRNQREFELESFSKA